MKYIYTSSKLERNLCNLFEIEYVPAKPERIEIIKTNSIPPINLGIDIGVIGKEPWNKGKKTGPLSEEHKAILSIANKGYIKGEEHRNNLSVSLRGNKNGKNNTKPKTPEHREKIRQTLLKKHIEKKL